MISLRWATRYRVILMDTTMGSLAASRSRVMKGLMRSKGKQSSLSFSRILGHNGSPGRNWPDFWGTRLG